MNKKILNGKMIWILAVILVFFMTAGVAEEILCAGHYAYILKDGLVTIVDHIDSEYGWQYWFGDRPDTWPPSLLVEDESAGYHLDADEKGATANYTLVIPERLDGYPVVAIGGVGQEWAFLEGPYTDVIIPEGVVSIRAQAFSHCNALGALTIPASVTSIGEDCFVGISSGQPVLRVTEGSYAAQYAQENEIPYTYDAQFRFIKSGEWLYTLADDTATIYGFGGYSDDDGNVIIPDHLDGHPVTAIEDGVGFYAFSRSGLTSVTIPQSVASIGDWVFSSCYELSSVIFPEGVTSIGKHAFAWCSGLTSVAIPASVTFIGEEAFSGCEELTLTVTEGSYAEQYAKENDIPYVFTTE